MFDTIDHSIAPIVRNKVNAMLFKSVFAVIFLTIVSLNRQNSSMAFVSIPKEFPLDEYHRHLLEYVEQVFCAIKSKFINISIGKRVAPAFSNHILRNLTVCLACGIMVNR